MLLRLGLGLGLASAAGIRTYFPLIVMGLLTRFSDTMTYIEPFRVFASAPVILLLASLALFERTVNVSHGNQYMLVVILRALGGAIVFAGTFTGFGIFGGIFFGAVIAILAHLVTVRLSPDTGKIIEDSSVVSASGLEETIAIIGTLLAVLLPWSSYLLWALILLLFVKRMKDNKQRYRMDIKAKSWR